MSFNQSFDQKSEEFSNRMDEEDLSNFVYAFKKLGTILLKSPKEDHISFLRRQIEELNALRKKFPAQEKLLSTALFDIYQQAQNNPNDFCAQSMTVALINSFGDVPPQNIDSAKGLCQAIQKCRYLQNAMSGMQRLLTILSNMYPKLKKKDTDLDLAKKIKETVLFCLSAKKKPTLNDHKWARQISQTLVKEHPVPKFQSFAEAFPFKASPTPGNKEELPKDAVITYNVKAALQPSIFLKGGRD